jgi:hypothetical protein
VLFRSFVEEEAMTGIRPEASMEKKIIDGWT